MNKLTTSVLGIRLIQKYEGLKLSAYLCPAGVWTIGYGHIKGVKEGDMCSEAQALQYLKDDLQETESFLNNFNLGLSQREFDALVSWIFNLGIGNFKSSTLLQLVISQSYHKIVDIKEEEIVDYIGEKQTNVLHYNCLLYTSPSPRDS